MKVLFITDPGVIGGATRSLVELVSTLHERYSIECVVCTSKSIEICQELQKYGINSILTGHKAVMEVRPDIRQCNRIKAYIKSCLKYAGFYCGLLNLRYKLSINPTIKCIESKVDVNSFDLIHTNSSRNDIGCVLSRKYGIPHIMHIREFGQEDFNCWIYRPQFYSFLNQYTTAFIAISKAVKNSWVKKGINESKVHVIYNGVNGDAIIPAHLDDMRSSEILKLVAVGGVCPPKGQHQIIEAMEELPRQIRKKVTLDIIGWSDGQYIEGLKNRIEQLGLINQINFLGARNDVYNLLQNYHVGLTCSKSEGFGRVTAEYMHAGLGVIASDTGANPELISDGVTGQLYKLGNIEDLAKKIICFYKERKFLCHCATNGKDFAKANYTKELNADSIAKIYKGIIK